MEGLFSLEPQGSTGGRTSSPVFKTDMASTADGNSPDLRRGVRQHADATPWHDARTVEPEHPLGPASARQGMPDGEHMEKNVSQTTTTLIVKSEHSLRQQNLIANREGSRKPSPLAKLRTKYTQRHCLATPITTCPCMLWPATMITRRGTCKY